MMMLMVMLMVFFFVLVKVCWWPLVALVFVIHTFKLRAVGYRVVSRIYKVFVNH